MQRFFVVNSTRGITLQSFARRFIDNMNQSAWSQTFVCITLLCPTQLHYDSDVLEC